MINECSLSPNLRKTISEPQTGMCQQVCYQKVAGSITVWGSEIVFLRLGFDERSSII